MLRGLGVNWIEIIYFLAVFGGIIVLGFFAFMVLRGRPLRRRTKVQSRAARTLRRGSPRIGSGPYPSMLREHWGRYCRLVWQVFGEKISPFMHSECKRMRTDPIPIICYSQRHSIRPGWDTSVFSR